jgi:energy-converting hydrogenase Eha subunit A
MIIRWLIQIQPNPVLFSWLLSLAVIRRRLPHNTLVLFLDSNSQLSTKFDVIYTDYYLEIYIWETVDPHLLTQLSTILRSRPHEYTFTTSSLLPPPILSLNSKKQILKELRRLNNWQNSTSEPRRENPNKANNYPPSKKALREYITWKKHGKWDDETHDKC